MKYRNIIISLSFFGGLSGTVLAQERPWGIITPFGNVVTEQRGFQGRYNPWEMEIVEGVEESATEVRKPIRQGWQNIYRSRPPSEEEQWPNDGKKVKKGKGGSKSSKRMFGDSSLSDEEQWPDRSYQNRPYRPSESFGTPFGSFAPNMLRPPFSPYGGSYPSWRR